MAPLLRVSPEEVIEFPLVLYTPLNSTIKLENTSEGNVAFKIKTTAPKGYLVRPSTGIVRPGEVQSVQIILQPLSEAPKVVTDRFLVQSVSVKNDEVIPKDIWTRKDLVQDVRLSVSLVKETGLNIQSGSSPHGIPPRIAARLLSPQSPNVDITELRQKYEELVNYCLSVEKLKTGLVKENEQLRQKLNLGPGESIVGRRKVEIWHMVAVVLLIAFILKLAGQY